MVELKQRYFPDVSLHDLRTTIGVVFLCKSSGEILLRAAGQSHDLQLRRMLKEAARQRTRISEQLIPKTELGKPVVEHVQRDFDNEIAIYDGVEKKLDTSHVDVVDENWVKEFHQADQKVLKSVRTATRAVEGHDLATRLSSLVASYRLSSEKLYQSCAQI